MASVVPIEELREMTQNQIMKFNKETLIASIRASSNDGGALIQALHNKLEEISKELLDLKAQLSSPESGINQKMAKLQEKVDKQAEIIASQQNFLEALDRRERESRLVIPGVPDEGETSDQGKLQKVWNKIGEVPEVKFCRRLGRGEPGARRWPILVTLPSREARDEVLANTRRLKEAGAPYERVFVKKDVHPSVRNEWKRLRDVEAAEKGRPENVGCVVRLDTRERKVYRDNVVIGSWQPAPF